MKLGSKVKVKNQSVPDFFAYVVRFSDLYQTADVSLQMPENENDEVSTMTFSYSDIDLVN